MYLSEKIDNTKKEIQHFELYRGLQQPSNLLSIHILELALIHNNVLLKSAIT